ncbi:ATP-binding protein [Caenimonas aquaedulcis]|uniref:histidine kinase n=1 Tax=Caenimonas aquaedulcis TaxID=2793270 RepID=A0A931H2U2_9BURK|nr:ATP-binding protein [Caenimonas aquaedulcis]MBG9387546.1 sensor histidine kinase N-terminal domain-containing protein [Caenimonas aquaedulcis]
MSEVPAPTPHSLRRRLLWLVLAAIALVSTLQASTAYRTALQQADTMFDYHLQELARSVHGGVPFTRGDGSDDHDFQVQIWGPDGAQIFRSAGTALPSQAVLGFSDVSVQGVRFRVYSLQTPEHTIQIAQDLDARQARARALAARAVLPIALLAPLLMMAVWWLISRSLAPVERMRRQVAGRAADDLAPLPDAGLPQEVLPLVQEINLLFARVRGAFEAQQHFVADAAHELRSPLTALKLQAQALRRAQDEPAREAAVARLNEGIDRAIQLVSQLLVLAREEGEDAGSEPQRIGLQDLVRQVVADVLPQAQARRVDIGMTTHEEAIVRGQREPLHILLRNLLDNAVKYAPEGGQVDIALSNDDAGALLVVEDNGPGIPPDERERVFDRFYRTQDAQATGSGLGLAIVRTIAARHGASVSLLSSPRLGGLRVEVRFPPA